MFHWEKSEEITQLLKHLSATVAVGVPVEGTMFFDNIDNYIGDVNFTTPQKLWDTSDYEFTKLLAIRRHLKGNSHTSIACIDVQEEDSSPSDEDHSQSEHGSLLLQEAVLSPMRMLHEYDDVVPDSSSPKSYHDCLKVFNFVFNYCKTQKGSTEILCNAMWEVYNNNVTALTTKNKNARNEAADIVSFPAVHTGSKSKRQKTAGYL
jgi:hypothetical protein